MFELSDSEKIDVLSIDAGEIMESLPLQSHTHEELVDVLTHAVAKLNINWPQERQEVQVANWMSASSSTGLSLNAGVCHFS